MDILVATVATLATFAVAMWIRFTVLDWMRTNALIKQLYEEEERQSQLATQEAYEADLFAAQVQEEYEERERLNALERDLTGLEVALASGAIMHEALPYEAGPYEVDEYETSDWGWEPPKPYKVDTSIYRTEKPLRPGEIPFPKGELAMYNATFDKAREQLQANFMAFDADNPEEVNGPVPAEFVIGAMEMGVKLAGAGSRALSQAEQIKAQAEGTLKQVQEDLQGALTAMLAEEKSKKRKPAKKKPAKKKPKKRAPARK